MKTSSKNILFWFVPIMSGFSAGSCIIFLGENPGWKLSLWLTTGFTALLIFSLLSAVVAKLFLHGRKRLLQAGFTFLISTAVTPIILSAVFLAFYLLDFDTEYAPGYSDKAFDSIAIGDSYETVLSKLGKPLSFSDNETYENWIYSVEQQSEYSKNGHGKGTFTTFTFDETGKVKAVSGQIAVSSFKTCYGDGQNYLKLTNDDINELCGKSKGEILKQFHSPAAVYNYKAAEVLTYSRSPSGSNYHLRSIGMDSAGKVVNIYKSFYWD